MELAFTLPPLEPGHRPIELDCVSDRVCWFRETGSPTKRVQLRLATMHGAVRLEAR